MMERLHPLRKGVAWVLAASMLMSLCLFAIPAAATTTILNVDFTELDFSAPVLQPGGTEGAPGAVYLYDHVITKDGIDVDATITIVSKSSASPSLKLYYFDAEGSGHNAARFEPVLNSPSEGGSFTFQIDFWDHNNPGTPVYLYGFALTGVDIDGPGRLETISISGYASYVVDQSTQLVITYPGDGITKFTGRNTDLSGIQFEDTAAFIAYYTAPITTMTLILGNTGEATGSSNRQYSLNFGNVGGVFSNPKPPVPNPSAPDLTVEITDVAGILDNRVSDLTAVVLSGATDAGVGQEVFLSVTDGTNTVTGSAIVQVGGTYSTTMDLSGLLPGLITATANVVSTGGTPAAPATDTSTIVRYHNVVFVDYDDTVIKPPQSVIYGGAAEPPASDPARSGYIFAGWDTDYDNVTQDLTVKALYNAVPVAVDDAAETNANTAKVITVLSNDSDPDGHDLTVTDVSLPAHGAAVINPGGTVTYTPEDKFTGTDTFTYTISDGHGGTDTATVTVTVLNTPPVAVDDAVETKIATAKVITVLANDSDPDGHTLTVTGVATPPSHGLASVVGNTIMYMPNGGYIGTDTFTYTISDGHGGTDTATVTVTVLNTSPIAVDDTAETNANTAKTIYVLLNDGDEDGHPLTVTGVSDPANGTAVINPGGTVTYTPTNKFTGTDTFTYTISDGKGGTDTATVTVTVLNTPPVAVDDAAETKIDVARIITVLSNDSDPDGHDLTVTGVSDPAHGAAAINPDGTVTYTPDPGFTGTDTFTYTLSDEYGATDTATVTVTVTNTSPIAVDDSAETNANTAKEITVLSNDSDPDGHTLTVTGVSDPANGTAIINPGGTVTYTPTNKFTGTDTFTYTISDGKGGTDTATVTVTVLNTPPVALDDAAETTANTAKEITVLSNDGDPDGHTLTVTDVSDPAHGAAVINPGGTVTYTPDPGFTGTDTFTYTLSDEYGATDTATVTVTVLNTSPIAVDDSAETNANTAKEITVLSNDSDPDGHTLTVTGVSDPANGTAVINPGGTVIYTPNDKFTGTDSFTYTISDGHGGADTATVTVTVLNTPPVALDDAAETNANTAKTITVLSNDSDADHHTLTVTGVSDPANGAAVINPDGTVTYTPDPGFTGTDTFTYTLSDEYGATDTATVTVTVLNTSPIAVDDSAETNANTAKEITVLPNDSDPDGHTLTVTGVSDPANGTAVINPGGTQ